MLTRGPTASAIRDGTALPVPSIVGPFSPPPELPYVDDSVAMPVCPRVLVAGPVSLAAQHGGVQNDSRRATTPGGQAGMRTAAPSPRSGERAPLPHVGRSDSP